MTATLRALWDAAVEHSGFAVDVILLSWLGFCIWLCTLDYKRNRKPRGFTEWDD